MIEVSVVILNYNGWALTREAINSVLAQRDVELEIIVIDNGSIDGSKEKLSEEFRERIKLILNSENIGFSPANNQGFKVSRGEWIAILNNDAVADPRWLKRSLAKAKTGERVGAVIPKIINFYDRERLDGIGVGFWLDGITRANYRGEIDSERMDEAKPEIFSGCACLLLRRMIEQLGGFDEDFFAYSEDTDLGVRARLCGWESVYEPGAIVYHKYSRTTSERGGYSGFKLYLVERNRLWVLFRYYPWYLIMISPITSFLRYVYLAAQALGRSKSRAKGAGIGLIFSLLKAIFQGLSTIPKQIKWRRKWVKTSEARAKMKRMIFKHFIPVSEISRLD